MTYLNSNKIAFCKGIKTVLLAVFVLLSVVACGKKGPLYMPKTTAATEQKIENEATKKPPEADSNNADTTTQK